MTSHNVLVDYASKLPEWFGRYGRLRVVTETTDTTLSFSVNGVSIAADRGHADTEISVPGELLEALYKPPPRFAVGAFPQLPGVQVTGDALLYQQWFLSIENSYPWDIDRMRAIDARFGEHPAELKVRRMGSRHVRYADLHSDGLPTIVSGLFDGMESLSWNFSVLRKRFGHLKLKHAGVTLGEAICAIENAGISADESYSPTWNEKERALVYVSEICPMHVELPDGLEMDGFDISPPALLIHPLKSGPCTYLHRDCYTGLNLQIAGRKRVVLFPPDQADKLYLARWNLMSQMSYVDLASPDLSRHPKFADAESITVTVEPGDMIVLPAGWFHAMFSESGPVTSVSFFGAPSERPLSNVWRSR